MAAVGATVSSAPAGAVITGDRIECIADAVHIGRRALRIARRSVPAGMSLSFGSMSVAAFWYLPPTAGALFHEAAASR